ncbi:hypothetical protein ACFL59_14055 [Planctomycetota bacterium]
MPSRSSLFFVVLLLFFALGLVVLHRELSATRTPFHGHSGAAATEQHGPAEFPEVLAVESLEGLEEQEGTVIVPPPPLSEDYWPCSGCHDPDDANPTRRVLEDEHTDIVLQHDEDNRWCLDCHDLKDRDMLRLASGAKVPFSESYRLCGQCHGTIYRDWKAGIHGRRTGYWDGPKRYLLCVHCHWPHAPRFKPVKPLPPPVRPAYLSATPRGAPHPSAEDAGSVQETTGGNH